MQRRVKRICAALAVVAVLAGGALMAERQLDRQMLLPSATSAPVRFEVAAGAPLRSVLLRLQRLGALPHARLVQLDLRLHGQSPRIQAGRYEIAPHASPSQIIEQLVEGRVVLVSLTVVEGWSLAQMRHALDSDPDVEHQLRGVSDSDLMKALGHPGQPAEGSFFPDTYRFAAGTSDRSILELAYQRMQSTLRAYWAQRAADLPLHSPAEALTLASIIEKETGRADERAKIAAVFINRMRLGMRLQSDPTVIYGLGARYDGSIHTRDLTTDTPYNTYTRSGLPPTPIALPSAASLEAALHPDGSDALYFVASGEGDGSHRFSATLAEHDVALRSYLRHLGVPSATASASARKGAGSSPAQSALP